MSRLSCIAVLAAMISGSPALFSQGTTATMITPVPGSAFGDSGVVFHWTVANGATRYHLLVGNSLGSGIYGNWYTTQTSQTITNLPLDGRTIYVRLYTQFGSTYLFVDYTYRAAIGPTTAAIISPSPGSVLPGSAAVFTWSLIPGATRYFLQVGTSLASSTYDSIYSTGNSVTAQRLPLDGRTIYVRLTTLFGSTPYSADYTYQAFSSSYTPPSTSGLRFVPVPPCRIADTRLAFGTFGAPSMGAGSTRDFPVPLSNCGIPFSAKAYSLNVTVVPAGPLAYITLNPTGQARPLVSTLNSFDGRIKANAAIIPAGAGGSITAAATDRTDLILDVNGYFVPQEVSSQALAFYPVAPCRLLDTRDFPGAFGGPAMDAGTTRDVPANLSNCRIPTTARAYSLNATVYPAGGLAYLTLWPTGGTQPLVSTLNAFTGTVVSNAAIVPAGVGGAISAFVTDRTDLTIDINGYFDYPVGAAGLSFYTLNPCRLLDTRNTQGLFGGPSLNGALPRSYTIPSSACNVPAAARAYTVNATVVPYEPLPELILWAAGTPQPATLTLSALDRMVTSNAAILSANYGGAISALASANTEFLLDINGYFAP